MINNHIENKNSTGSNLDEKEFLKKLKAAYALNLCMVSVSQIVQYNDLNIMEQEYENILNNLNLENFPKDEALLTLLKQILNTITFFRIQEGDKKFVEKNYQEKLKNAIWNCVPNVSMIVATGNPFVAIGALAAQVGIGYMNYRKEKAKAISDKEKEMWELERNAIEQFNLLRSELFTTAWRLADSYGFKDEWRLTENQINEYNEILMDPLLIRRYERLDRIKGNFYAYPIFWYQLGDTAIQIANDALSNYKNLEITNINAVEANEKLSIYKQYKQAALKHFDLFYQNTKEMQLLRTNQIASSCYLEYVDTLLLDNTFQNLNNEEKNKVQQLIDLAEKSSGDELDILQLCAMDYLKIGNYEKACKLLRVLVVEDFNKNTNAQLLSQFYLQKAIEDNSLDLLPQYLTLKRFVDSQYLYPFPKKLPQTMEEKDAFNFTYCLMQKYILKNKFALVYANLINKYSIEFNKILQNPDCKEHPDSYFSDTSFERENRLNNLKLGSNHKTYIENLRSCSISVECLNVINDFVLSLRQLDFEDELGTAAYEDKLKENLLDMMGEICKIEKNLMESDVMMDTSKAPDLSKFLFSRIIEDYMNEVITKTNNHISNFKNFSEISLFEGQLRKLCISQKIKEPDILFHDKDKQEEDSEELPFNYADYLSDNIMEQKKFVENKKAQLKILTEYSEKISCDKKAKLLIKGINDSQIEKYFMKSKFKLSNKDKRVLSFLVNEKIIAVIGDTHFTNSDIIFTTSFIIYSNKNNLRISKYSKINEKQDRNCLFENPNIIRKNLEELISSLSQYEENIPEPYSDRIDILHKPESIFNLGIFATNKVSNFDQGKSKPQAEIKNDEYTSLYQFVDYEMGNLIGNSLFNRKKENLIPLDECY